MPSPLPAGGLSLTRGGIAVVAQPDGQLDGGVCGVWFRDRRVLRSVSFRVDGVEAALLQSHRETASCQVLTFALSGERTDPIGVLTRRLGIVDGGYFDEVAVESLTEPVTIELSWEIAAGGATLYGLDEPEPTAAAAELVRSGLLTGEAEVDDSSSGAAAGGRWTLRHQVDLRRGASATVAWRLKLQSATFGARPQTLHPTIEASDPRLQRAIDRAIDDLDALTLVDSASGCRFLAAGAPHFLALFGRDALIASLLSMVGGDIARTLETLEALAHHQGQTDAPASLEALARHQGRTDAPASLEQAGRILHELRIGEMGVFGLAPGAPYFGSIDASALFVIALNECRRWGADRDRIAALLPAARGAIQWCFAHTDALGFVQSLPDASGLGNHSWKDRFDSMIRRDGTHVVGPNSPAEVQGYLHSALHALADLETDLGTGDPAPLRAQADLLVERFDRHFRSEHAVIGLALDGDGELLDVKASNAGHLLATGLIDDETAAKLAVRMLSPSEFSGWGVRTVAADERAFTPLGYHTGTVWPHDNAMLLRGLTRRGLGEAARVIVDALLDLVAATDGQLPELVGGFDRGERPEPVPYLASARPQAWSAATVFQIVSSLLGMRVDVPAGVLSFDPLLADGERITIRNLRLGERLVTIDANGTTVTVTG